MYHQNINSNIFVCNPHPQIIFNKSLIILKYALEGESAYYQLARLYLHGEDVLSEHLRTSSTRNLNSIIQKLLQGSVPMISKTKFLMWKYKIPYLFNERKTKYCWQDLLSEAAGSLFKASQCPSVGYAKAQLTLCQSYEDGTNGFSKNTVISRDWCVIAAKQNLPKAIYKLGKLKLILNPAYFDPSESLNKDAVCYIKDAALKGDAEAQNMLGILYFYGHKVSQILSKERKYAAMHWIGHAAIQDNANAKFNLQVLFEKSYVKNIKNLNYSSKDYLQEKEIKSSKIFSRARSKTIEWVDADVATAIQTNRLRVKKEKNKIGQYATPAFWLWEKTAILEENKKSTKNFENDDKLLYTSKSDDEVSYFDSNDNEVFVMDN